MKNKQYAVVNGIIFSKNRILIVKRREGIHAGKWAFPGGLVENESLFDALKREIREETGLEILNKKEYISDYCYERENGENTTGTCFLVYAKNEKVKINNEIEEFKWIKEEDLGMYNLIEGLEEEALIAFRKAKNEAFLLSFL